MKALFATAALCSLTPALFAADRLPADLAALIPAEASSLVYIAPIDDIEEAAQELLGLIAPDMAMVADADMILTEFAPAGFNIDLIDRSRPFAIAVGPITMQAQDEAPQVMLIIPTTDAAALDLSLPPHASRISGGYLGITESGSYPASGGSNLPALLPEGLIAATIDLEPIVESFKPMAGMILGMARSSMIGEIGASPEIPPDLRGMLTGAVNSSFGFVDDAMASLSRVELGLDLAGTEFHAGYAILFKEGSPLTRLAGNGPALGDMLPFIDAGAVSTSVVGMDFGALARWARPYFDRIMDGILEAASEEDLNDPDAELGPFDSPLEAYNAVRETLSAGLDTLGWFGDAGATSVYFVGDQMRTATWVHGVSADQLATSIAQLFQVQLAGLAGLRLEQTKIGETTTNLRLSFDAEVLARNFGLDEGDVQEAKLEFTKTFGDAINVSLTAVGRQTLMIYNGDRDSITAALRAVQKNSAKNSPALTRAATELAGAYPFGLYHIDLGPAIAGYAGVAAAMGEDTDMPPEFAAMLQNVHIPLTALEGLTKERAFQSLTIDLGGIAPLIQMAMERR